MAFSSSPIKDTYSSHRIPLVQTVFKDRPDQGVISMKNVLPYKYKKGNGEQEEIYTESRAGIKAYNVTGGTTTDVCRGLYVWEKTQGTVYYFVVVGTAVYTATAIAGPWTSVNTLLTSATTPVRFTEFIDDSNTKKLILVDGVEGYVYTTNAAGTKIVDADFPTPHIPFPVFLNGRMYLAKANTGDIYNSALNDPATWTAGDFISSEVYPDDVQALVKINNYILAIGAAGSEYFYDAANSTGSPLARETGASLPFGTIMPNTIAFNQDTACFMTKGSDGEYCLRVIEGLKHKEVPASFLVEELADVLSGASTNAKLRAYFFRQNGDLFYAIARDGTIHSNEQNYFHYVYSFQTDIWTSFTRGAGTTRTTYGDSAHYSFPVYFSAPGDTNKPLTYVAGQSHNAVFAGHFHNTQKGIDEIPLNSASNSTLWYLNSIPTDGYDFGTRNLKMMYRLGIAYSNTYDGNADATGEYIPRVSWADGPPTINGYTTPRMLVGGNFTNSGSSTYGYDFPFITQLGAFRQRYFLIECYGGMEFSFIEVDINKGQQ